jgi:uncharacterized protein
MTQKQTLTYDEIHAWCMQLADQMHQDAFVPDVIMGIARGGLLPALILSHHFRVPLVCHHVSLRDHVQKDAIHQIAPLLAQGKRMLILDDINDSGATIQAVKAQLNQLIVSYELEHVLPDQVRFGVLIHKKSSTQSVDYHAHVVYEADDLVWWHFPWEKSID